MSKKKSSHSNSAIQINIVGNNKLQNDLLLSFIKEKNCLKVKCSQKLKSESDTHKYNPTKITFLLVDFKEYIGQELWAEIDSFKSSLPPQSRVALFNVDPKKKIEKRAMNNKISGVFYQNDSPNVIIKGISAILSGDLWFSRRDLVEQVLESNHLESSLNYVKSCNLTTREKEILYLITLGYTNKNIADKLCISIHTVKTHVYNLYKKINAKNRFQAILWGIKSL